MITKPEECWQRCPRKITTSKIAPIAQILGVIQHSITESICSFELCVTHQMLRTLHNDPISKSCSTIFSPFGIDYNIFLQRPHLLCIRCNSLLLVTLPRPSSKSEILNTQAQLDTPHLLLLEIFIVISGKFLPLFTVSLTNLEVVNPNVGRFWIVNKQTRIIFPIDNLLLALCSHLCKPSQVHVQHQTVSAIHVPSILNAVILHQGWSLLPKEPRLLLIPPENNKEHTVDKSTECHGRYVSPNTNSTALIHE